MPRPSFVDYAIGNLLVHIALVGWFAFTGYAYVQGDESQLLLVFVTGFLVLWSWAARKRVIGFKRYQAEWREAEAAPSSRALGPSDQAREVRRPGIVRRTMAAIGNTLLWLLIIFAPSIVINFVWGIFQKELPPIRSVLPGWFLDYPGYALQAVLDAYGWFMSPRLPTLPAGVNAWLLAALIVALLLFLLLRRRRRRRRMPATPRAGTWKGTVQVVVPPPR